MFCGTRQIKLTSLFVVFFFLFTVTGAARGHAAENTTEAEKTIIEVFEYLNRSHISNPSAGQLVEGAVQGMIDSLEDPYTDYMNDWELYQMINDLEGAYEGVGIELEGKPDYPLVRAVFPDSPAAGAGVQKGDIIKDVNGQDIKGRPLTEVVDRIKGPVGTEVTLGIDREGAGIRLKMKRAQLNVPSVESKVVGRNTGYIAVQSFSADTANEFRTHLGQLASRNITGLIIDLRYNPGGYLEAALEMGEQMLQPGKVIVVTRNADGSAAKFVADEDNNEPKVPVVILVNSQTASSAELFAAALQDNGVAGLVGEITYGKGVAQNVVPLETGGALKITTTEYTTPKDRKVNKKGLTPDYQVLTRELQLPFAVRLLEPGAVKLVFTPGSSEVAVGNEKMLTRKPLIRNNTTFLPLRFTFEALGYEVSWEEMTGSVTAEKENTRIMFPAAGNPQLNGSEIKMPGQVYTAEGAAYISVDLIKALGITCTRSGEQIVIQG